MFYTFNLVQHLIGCKRRIIFTVYCRNVRHATAIYNRQCGLIPLGANWKR
jgi:hypothetical protein